MATTCGFVAGATVGPGTLALPLRPAALPAALWCAAPVRCGIHQPAFSSTRPVQGRRATQAGAGARVVVMASNNEMDLTEENIEAALIECREDLGALFDESVGITGRVTLAELDGPFVKLRLSGRFWHERSMILLRVGHYLQTRIPEILEVEIEDETQLDDSPEAFNA